MKLRLFPAPRQLEATGDPLRDPGRTPEVARDAALPGQGFELATSRRGIAIRHADAAGLRYARGLLDQLRRRCGSVLPGLRIRDWPDFPVRGYLLDVSRDRVPTRETLERLVARLERFRINHLQLYTEHSFAYRGHEVVWRDASPLTAGDLRWLDARCREAGIELAANQNCFGHMERWLRHAPYRRLAETPGGWSTQRAGRRPPSVLAPDEESARFVLGLLDELLPNFTSRRVHIGCDETFELGKGRSRAQVEARGRGRVYLDFLLRLLRPLHERGREVLFWGDILLDHPDLLAELPSQATTACVWHYEAPAEAGTALPEDLNELLRELGVNLAAERLAGFDAHAAPFAERGFPFWVCPGTSSWNSLVGRLENARANLLDAARVGAERGAAGYLITDWGDNGHWQPPSVSLAPLAFGAGVAWCRASNGDADLAGVLDEEVFEDAARELGAALVELGSLWARTGLRAFNASPLQAALLSRALRTWGRADAAGLGRTLDALGEASSRIARSQPTCSDGAIVRRELLQAARLARHGAWRIARQAGFARPADAELRADLAEAIEEQRACWLARSRPGGLEDSLARLRALLRDYAAD